jgi:ABC-2 type transport system permease protein
MSTWSKYGSVTKQAFINTITYRSEVFLWFFLDLFPFVVLMLVWMAVYKGQPTLGGYSLDAVLQYYFLVMVVTAVSSHHFEQHRVQQIRDGKIDYYLTRPFSYLGHLGWSAFGNKLFSAVTSVLLASVSMFFLQLWLPISLPSVTIPVLIQFIVLLVGAYLIEYFSALIIVLAGFWFENAEGLEHFKWIVLALFSGQLMPIVFMPPWLQHITTWLPFKFISAIPIGVLQQTIILSWTDWLYLGSTITGLWLLCQVLWHYAQYRYSSAGG